MFRQCRNAPDSAKLAIALVCHMFRIPMIRVSIKLLLIHAIHQHVSLISTDVESPTCVLFNPIANASPPLGDRRMPSRFGATALLPSRDVSSTGHHPDKCSQTLQIGVAVILFLTVAAIAVLDQYEEAGLQTDPPTDLNSPSIARANSRNAFRLAYVLCRPPQPIT